MVSGILLPGKDGVTVTARQKKFAEYYAQCGNTVQSAIKAGYSENYANSRAHEMLENVGIAEYIRELSEKAQKARVLTALQRQEILSNIAKSAAEESADRIRAIDTLNKMTGEYMLKAELNGGMGVCIVDDIKNSKNS